MTQQTWLIDCGAWPRSYTISTNIKTLFWVKIHHFLYSQGWHVVKRFTWVKANATLTIHPEGYSIYQGDTRPSDDFINELSEPWCRGAGQYYHASDHVYVLPSDRHITNMLLQSTYETLTAWVKEPLYSNSDSSAQALLARLQLLQTTIPLSQDSRTQQYMHRIQQLVSYITFSAKVTRQRDSMHVICRAVGTTILPLSTYLLGAGHMIIGSSMAIVSCICAIVAELGERG